MVGGTSRQITVVIVVFCSRLNTLKTCVVSHVHKTKLFVDFQVLIMEEVELLQGRVVLITEQDVP